MTWRTRSSPSSDRSSRCCRQHGETHGLADLHLAGVRALQTLDHAQQRGLARAVLADDAVAVARADDPVHVVEDRLVVEAHAHVLEVDHLLAQARHGHALELQLVAQRRHVGDEFLGGGHVELRLRSHAPVQPRDSHASSRQQLVLAFLLRLARARDAPPRTC